MSPILQVVAVVYIIVDIYFSIRRIRDRSKYADQLTKAGRQTTNYHFHE